MTSVQLPEDLRKSAYAAANKTYNELQHSNVVTFAIVDAVLTALLDACEVHEIFEVSTGGATHRQLVITTPLEPY